MNNTHFDFGYAASPMTADRAIFFLERFKSEEKMLGPNEQAALDFAIAKLAAPAMPVTAKVVGWHYAGQVYPFKGAAVSEAKRDGYGDESEAQVSQAYITLTSDPEPVAWLHPHGGVLQRLNTGLEHSTHTIPLFTAVSFVQGEPVKLTRAQFISAAKRYRTDFELLPEEEQRGLIFDAVQWDQALQDERAALRPEETAQLVDTAVAERNRCIAAIRRVQAAYDAKLGPGPSVEASVCSDCIGAIAATSAEMDARRRANARGIADSVPLYTAAPAPKAQSDSFPDECVATGLTCTYGPHGPRGEIQCKYCGATPDQP